MEGQNLQANFVPGEGLYGLGPMLINQQRIMTFAVLRIGTVMLASTHAENAKSCWVLYSTDSLSLIATFLTQGQWSTASCSAPNAAAATVAALLLDSQAKGSSSSATSASIVALLPHNQIATLHCARYTYVSCFLQVNVQELHTVAATDIATTVRQMCLPCEKLV